MTRTAAGPIAIDTSVSVPLLVVTHPDHGRVQEWGRGRRLLLSGHAAAETYSVLTRMPGDMNVAAKDAVAMLAAHFADTPTLPRDVAGRIPEILAEVGIFGGAVYDGLVALAAIHHDLPLATRDRRALPTYAALGARVEVVG